MRRLLVPLATAALLLSAMAAPAAAAGPKPYPGPILDRQLVNRAVPSECYTNLTTPPTDIPASLTCPPGQQPKVDQHYVWATARSGNYAYFGTGSNVVCNGAANQFRLPDPQQSGYIACQYQYGQSADALGSASGDVKTPKILQVDSRTGRTRDVTPPQAEELLFGALGLRGAGAHNDVVMFFGQKLKSDGSGQVEGLAAVAIEGSTGRYLGSELLTEWGGLRNGLVASDGNLYLGTRTTGEFGGTIVRWSGTKTDPFQFDTVTTQQSNEMGYLIEHNGRLAVSGWAYSNPTLPDYPSAVTNGPANIYLSQPIPKGGFTEDRPANLKVIFSYADYDPDPVIGKSIYWGGIVSWRGDLFFGSYQIDTVGTTLRSIWNAYDEPAATADKFIDLRNSFRPNSMFQVKNAGKANQRATLLYGDRTLPVRLPGASPTWVQRPNKLGQAPKLGPAGMGNPYNQYSWTWLVFQDRLYMGTFDVSGMVSSGSNWARNVLDLTEPQRAAIENVVGPALRDTYGGADLWRMDAPDRPAVAEDLSGLGNKYSYGIRTMLAFPDKGFFYVGTASGENLGWTPRAGTDRPGYEILKMTPGRPRAPIPAPQPPSGLDPALQYAAIVPAA